MTDQSTQKSKSMGEAKTPSTQELIQGQLTPGKLVFLVGVSVVLSLFGPLSLLAPVPLTMALLLYGPAKAGMVAGLVALLLWTGWAFLGSAWTQFLPLTGIFTLSLLYAFLTFRGIQQRLAPYANLVKSGLILLTLWASVFLGLFILTGYELQSTLTGVLAEQIEQFKTDPSTAPQYELLKNTTTPQAKLLVDSLERPDRLVATFLQWLPGGLVVATFFSLWICQFVILRNSMIWRQLWNYPYGFTELVRYRVPDYAIYGVIIGLALMLGSDYMGLPAGEVIGSNLLVSLAVFYFFQGFGVAVDGLAALRIGGLMRSLALMLIMFFAWRVVVLTGLFDTWINFRKFFRKNTN